jgi:hypothetical protein
MLLGQRLGRASVTVWLPERGVCGAQQPSADAGSSTSFWRSGLTRRAVFGRGLAPGEPQTKLRHANREVNPDLPAH